MHSKNGIVAMHAHIKRSVVCSRSHFCINFDEIIDGI